MTVQDLIDELMLVKDKSKEIRVVVNTNDYITSYPASLFGWDDICDPVPRSTMKLKFKTELRDDYKQEMVNAEQRDIQHKTDKGTYR